MRLLPRITPDRETPRDRALSALRSAGGSLIVAMDHYQRAGEGTPHQQVTRSRTAAQELQACIAHATMALYWMVEERMGP